EHPDLALAHSHDPALVLLSIAIAIGAAWVALDLAARTAAARGSTRGWWLAGGAVAMGIGIFSMHYIGMAAMRLPCSASCRSRHRAPVRCARSVACRVGDWSRSTGERTSTQRLPTCSRWCVAGTC